MKTKDMIYTAMFAVLIAVCSWLTIPAAVPFTMQTFGVFCALSLLGGRRATISVLVYILLGAIGIPVFSGFSGGIGVLVGPTGGYILGFLFMALVYRAVVRLIGDSGWRKAFAMSAGLAVCYTFGTVWFMLIYARASGPVGLATALGWCVLPFILPDAAKMALAVFVSSGVKKYAHIS